MATATIAAIPKNTAPTTCPSISVFAVPSVIHSNQPPQTSATALCGTTGMFFGTVANEYPQIQNPPARKKNNCSKRVRVAFVRIFLTYISPLWAKLSAEWVEWVEWVILVFFLRDFFKKNWGYELMTSSSSWWIEDELMLTSQVVANGLVSQEPQRNSNWIRNWSNQ